MATIQPELMVKASGSHETGSDSGWVCFFFLINLFILIGG